MRRLAVLALALAPSIPRPVGACGASSRDGGRHELDPSFADDQVAPSVIAVADVRVERVPSGESGCGSSRCAFHTTWVVLQLSATDDRAPVARIGYRFAVVGGQPPRDLGLGTSDLGLGTLLVNVSGSYSDGPEIGLPFSEDAGPFSFDLEVRAVDLNGNVGPPVVVIVES